MSLKLAGGYVARLWTEFLRGSRHSLLTASFVNLVGVLSTATRLHLFIMPAALVDRWSAAFRTSQFRCLSSSASSASRTDCSSISRSVCISLPTIFNSCCGHLYKNCKNIKTCYNCREDCHLDPNTTEKCIRPPQALTTSLTEDAPQNEFKITNKKAKTKLT